MNLEKIEANSEQPRQLNFYLVFIQFNLNYLNHRLIGTLKGPEKRLVFKGPRGDVYFFTSCGNKKYLDSVQRQNCINFVSQEN